MLAALLANIRPATGGSGDDADRLYWARRRANIERRRKGTLEAKEKRAQEALRLLQAVAPAKAEQIVAPYVVKLNERRYEIDWPLLIEQLVSYECLCALQQQIDDEDVLLLMAATT